MDRTETYIKMSDCPEIQEHTPEIGDYYWERHIDGEETVWIVYDTGHNDYQDLDWGTTWLPRQDQLQEMVEEKSSHGLARRISGFSNPTHRYRATFKGFPDEYYEDGKAPEPQPDIWLNEEECNYPEQFTSMEQLWLAFYMKENHNKVWLNEWIIQ